MTLSTAPTHLWFDTEARKPRRPYALYYREQTGEVVASVEAARHSAGLWHVTFITRAGFVGTQIVGDLATAKRYVEECLKPPISTSTELDPLEGIKTSYPIQ